MEKNVVPSQAGMGNGSPGCRLQAGGPINDMDSTYFNRQLVWATDGYLIPRRYTIPGRLVRAGRNTIVTRLPASSFQATAK